MLYPVPTGVLTAHSWLSLCRRMHRPINVAPTTLLDYAAVLEPNTFAPHFLKLTHLAATFHRLTERADDVLDADLVQSWAKLEYAALLSVVEMDTQFLDLRDDMPASMAAVVTHMLQNMIYLRLYGFLLCDQSQIGEALSLRPVPGVLYVSRSSLGKPASGRTICALSCNSVTLQASEANLKVHSTSSCSRKSPCTPHSVFVNTTDSDFWMSAVYMRHCAFHICMPATSP